MSNDPFSPGDVLTESDTPQQPSRLEGLVPLLEAIPLQHLESESGRGRRLFGRAIVLLLISILAYLPCFWNGLLDGERDRLLHLPVPEPKFTHLSQLVKWFTPGQHVPNLLGILIYLQHGPEGSAPLFSVVSLCLHAVSVLLLWLTLRRLSQPVAWLAALLFAVHPANVPAVAWVSQQGRLWGAVFTLSGTLLLLKNRGVPPEAETEVADYLGQESSPWSAAARSIASLIGSILFFLLAALCQPTSVAVVLPACGLICWRKTLHRNDYLILIPLAILAALATAIVLHSFVIQHDASAAIASTPLKKLLVFPGQILADGLLLHSTRSPWIDASVFTNHAALVLAVIWTLSLPVLFAMRRKITNGPFTAALCFILLLPTSIAPVAVHVSGLTLQGIINPAAGYLCQLPLIVLIAAGLFHLSLLLTDEIRRATTQLAAGTAIAISFAITTAMAAKAFDSTESLLISTVSADPNSATARSRLAEYYLANASPDSLRLARQQLPNCQPKDCDSAPTAVAWGDVRLAAGSFDDAIRWYQRAQAIDPSSSAATTHLATLYLRQNHAADAIACYQQAITLDPTDPDLHNDLGLLYGATRQPDAAQQQLKQALDADPDYVPAHINLANALISKGQLTEAAGELQKAVSLDPENFDAFHNAGFVLAQLHDYDHAIRLLTAAVQLKPDSADARNDLGVVLTAAGKYNRAIYEFQKALSLTPGNPSVQHNLSIAQRRLSTDKSATRSH